MTLCFILSMRLSSFRLQLGLPPATFWLLTIAVAVYVLQQVSRGIFGVPLEAFWGLSVSGAMKGELWQFLTYQFLHGSFFHLFLNMLMFVFLGAEVERAMGRRHFLTLYFISGVLGGLGWLFLTYPYEGVCVGASAAIFGLLSAFAVLYPHREVTLLVMFVFPITLRAWVLAVGLGIIQLLFTLSHAGGGIAYSAHLAGAIAGLIYALAVFRPNVAGDFIRRQQEAGARRAQANHARRAEQERATVNQLLDKISRKGIHSLTDAERKRLEGASRRGGR